MSETRARLLDLVRRFEGTPITVVGDPVLDVYIHGTTLRISREAPVPIVREDSREVRLGGAANAAANLAALGAKTRLVGLVGADDGLEDLLRLSTALGIDASGLLGMPERRTVTKTRVLAGGVHTTKQQLLRVDRENEHGFLPEHHAALMSRIETDTKDAAAVVISDYEPNDDGSLYGLVCRRVRALGIPVVVDSRFHLNAFAGATVVTPNEPEAEATLGRSIRGSNEALDAAIALKTSLSLDAAILTRGKQGMVVASRLGARDIPRHGSPEAVDVTGAGDTVTAVVALVIASGGSFEDAAILANLAASRVVQIVGTATCSSGQLEEILREADLAPFEVRT